MSFLSKLWRGKKGGEQPPAKEPERKDSESVLCIMAINPVDPRDPTIRAFIKNPPEIWVDGDTDIQSILNGIMSKKWGEFRACGKPDQPFVVGTPNGGARHIELWTKQTEKGLSDDPADMVMLMSDAAVIDGKLIASVPRNVFRGASASFVMIYRMSCCTDKSWTILIATPDGVGACDSTGVLPQMGKNMMVNKVIEVNPEGGQKMAEIFGRMNPSESRQGRDPAPL